MIKTKYGNIDDAVFKDYKKSLVDSVYKILPMKEEKIQTVDIYIESLICELIGAKEILKDIENKSSIAMIMFVLENLINEQDVVVVKREVFKTINIIKKM